MAKYKGKAIRLALPHSPHLTNNIIKHVTIMKKISILALLLTAMIFAGNASAQIFKAPSKALAEGEMFYSYDQGSDYLNYGNNKRESFDVAIRIKDANLVGKSVSGVQIPFSSTAGISGLKAWMSKSLKLENKVNVPDIASIDATPAKGWAEIRFAEPYTITEEGVYVGYSFSVDELADSYSGTPLVLAQGIIDADGLYVHTSRTTLKWFARSEQYGGSLAMKVIIDGAAAYSAGIKAIEPVNTEINVDNSVEIAVVNHGYSAISSFDYSYTLGDKSGSGSVDLSKSPIANTYGRSANATIALPAIAEPGEYPLSVTITKVNGEDNADISKTTATSMMVYKMLPKHRAALEEYTGLWCGWCPRGFVALEMMAEAYPDDFIGLSYHNGDIMEIMPSYQFPSIVEGFPTAFLEREKEIDAFYGEADEGIEAAWLKQCKAMAPASVDVTAVLAEGNKVSIDASVVFPLAKSGSSYSLAYILTADGLCGEGEDWAQANYYSGMEADPELSMFTSAGGSVSGLKFNDVVILTSPLYGIDGSIPAEIEAEVPITHSYELSLDDAVNTAGQSLVQDVNQLEVTALLIDQETGCIANAYKTKVLNPAGISSISNDNDDSHARFFDLSGRRLTQPAKGVCIKRTANGRAVKIMTR